MSYKQNNGINLEFEENVYDEEQRKTLAFCVLSKTDFTPLHQMIIFSKLVKNGSEGDLKNKEKYKKNELFLYRGEIVDRDALGNIAYGKLAKHVGFDDWVSYLGAGVAQLAAGTARDEFRDSFYDDPRDSYRIYQGMKEYCEEFDLKPSKNVNDKSFATIKEVLHRLKQVIDLF